MCVSPLHVIFRLCMWHPPGPFLSPPPQAHLSAPANEPWQGQPARDGPRPPAAAPAVPGGRPPAGRRAAGLGVGHPGAQGWVWDQTGPSHPRSVPRVRSSPSFETVKCQFENEASNLLAMTFSRRVLIGGATLEGAHQNPPMEYPPALALVGACKLARTICFLEVRT